MEKAILECEDAEFPELGPQLSLARDTLESLGGGRGGQNFKNLISWDSSFFISIIIDKVKLFICKFKAQIGTNGEDNHDREMVIESKYFMLLLLIFKEFVKLIFMKETHTFKYKHAHLQTRAYWRINPLTCTLTNTRTNHIHSYKHS